MATNGCLVGLGQQVDVVEQSLDRWTVEAHGDSLEPVIGGDQLAGKAAIGRDPEDSNILVSHGRLHARDEFRDTVWVDRSGEGLEVTSVGFESIGGGVNRAADERIGWGWVGSEAECESEVIEFEYGSVAERVDDFSGREADPAGGGSDQQHVGLVG